MKASYVLMDYYGQPWTGKGAGTYTDYKMDQPGQIFHATSGDGCSKMKLLGSLAYVLSTDRFQGVAPVLVTQLDCITIQDTVVVFQEGFSNKKRTFHLGSLKEGSAQNLVANRLTGIGEGSWIHSDWKHTSIQGSTLSAVPDPWTATTGANLCFRYENGVRTTTPLWPWPMNQRIIDAMAGETPMNVTAVVEKLLGSTPASCKGSSNGIDFGATTTVSIPIAPLDLRVNR